MLYLVQPQSNNPQCTQALQIRQTIMEVFSILLKRDTPRLKTRMLSNQRKGKQIPVKFVGKKRRHLFSMGLVKNLIKKGKDETRNYWEHQGCIGLKYKKKDPSQRCLISAQGIFKQYFLKFLTHSFSEKNNKIYNLKELQIRVFR